MNYLNLITRTKIIKTDKCVMYNIMLGCFHRFIKYLILWNMFSFWTDKKKIECLM